MEAEGASAFGHAVDIDVTKASSDCRAAGMSDTRPRRKRSSARTATCSDATSTGAATADAEQLANSARPSPIQSRALIRAFPEASTEPYGRDHLSEGVRRQRCRILWPIAEGNFYVLPGIATVFSTRNQALDEQLEPCARGRAVTRGRFVELTHRDHGGGGIPTESLPRYVGLRPDEPARELPLAPSRQHLTQQLLVMGRDSLLIGVGLHRWARRGVADGRG
jgi:hypothetical protein